MGKPSLAHLVSLYDALKIIYYLGTGPLLDNHLPTSLVLLLNPARHDKTDHSGRSGSITFCFVRRPNSVIAVNFLCMLTVTGRLDSLPKDYRNDFNVVPVPHRGHSCRFT